MPSEILSSVRVLDLTRVLAGPSCTQYLADMGATVIKIERPGTGDDSRHMPPFIYDGRGEVTTESAYFCAFNRGKQSVTVNITQPEGAAIVRAIAKTCDVLVENYKAGTLGKYGLDYASLRDECPQLIYCSITGFGHDGPYSKRPAYDSILQGLAGMMSMCGDPPAKPGSRPMRTGISIADLATGSCATIAVLGALFHKARTGQGQFIDATMIDASVALNAQYGASYLLDGVVPQRAGNAHPTISPSDVFKTADGEMLVICGNDKQFFDLCRSLQKEDLISDPRFRTNALRVEHRQDLNRLIEPVLQSRGTAEWVAIFDRDDVPMGAVNRIDQVFEDPQVRHRELSISLQLGSGEAIDTVRSPLRFSETPVVHRPPPVLGEHTDSILHELGKTEEEIAKLRDRGVI